MSMQNKLGKERKMKTKIKKITSVLLLASVIATIFSGWDYLKGGKDLFKDN